MTISPTDTEKIGAFYLKKLWGEYTSIALGKDPGEDKIEWKYVNALFNTLGLGLEPTTQYLLIERPSFSEFEEWVIKNGRIYQPAIDHYNRLVSPNRQEPLNLELKDKVELILDEEDLKQWDEKGYVIIKNAISKEASQRTVDLIYETIKADPDDPKTWYQVHPLRQGIMVQLFKHELLDHNRFSSRIRLAYEQLWKKSDLIVSMDRVGFNPPETDTYQFPGPNLHWDVSLKQPIPLGLQGILYLTDTQANQGAFTVIPGFHKIIGEWLDNYPAELNPREDSFKDFKTEPIAAKAGDFIIWHHCLPHGSSPNTATKPRIVQYINYQPIEMERQEEWI